MARAFAIMQEPGPRAARRSDEVARVYAIRYTPRPKRVGLVDADTAPGALLVFLRDRYPAGHAQFVAGRLEWRGAEGSRWRPDDGNDPRGRRWSVVVTLKNGVSIHEHRLEAWAR